MKIYNIKIRFITDYLQHRFTEDAKKELEEWVSKGIVPTTEDEWRASLYIDESGIFIPAVQIKKSLEFAGKEFKHKKKRSHIQQWVISNLTVQPLRIYINKFEPDKIETSYPKRKDGNRVKLQHPAFNAGLEIEFQINNLDDEMEDKTTENLVKTAGHMYGIGARRKDMFGRFELVEFKKL